MRHGLYNSGLQHRVEVDSAGIEAYHVGHPPDSRAIAESSRRGVSMEGLRARQVAPEDFESFDMILAMDSGHLKALKELAPPNHRNKIRFFMSYAKEVLMKPDVPDPYYGDARDFKKVHDLIDMGSASLLKALADILDHKP